MPLLTGALQFTGTLDGFSAYRMRGSDKIIIRRKGGPERQQIKQHENFAITRRQNEEWKACVAACGLLNRSLFPLRHLSDYNYTGTLTGLCKSIQKDDVASPLGKRNILLSQHYYKLEGFSLNKTYTLESFIKHPLQYELDKNNATAVVHWPDLVPGINLVNRNQHPLYRLVMVLGAVPDMVFTEDRKMYIPVAEEVFPSVSVTDWHTAKQTLLAGMLTASLPQVAGAAGYTLMLAVGIEFGVPVSNTEVRPIKRDGAAKVIRMG
jgi:hypothetical protein